MAQPTIDPTFYRTPAEAAAAPAEELAYVVAFDRAAQKNDAMTVIDVNPGSDAYGRVELPEELRWLHIALDGERLPWEAHLRGRSSLRSPGLGEASRTPFRQGPRITERSSGTTPQR
jgi:56kDa selenium binding protein (SBP56)